MQLAPLFLQVVAVLATPAQLKTAIQPNQARLLEKLAGKDVILLPHTNRPLNAAHFQPAR